LACAIVFGATAALAQGPNLVAAFFVKGKVGLKWHKVEGVEEYSVYRKASSGDFELIVKTGEDHYFDTEVSPGETYHYKVGIMSGGEEVFSSEKAVTIPGQSGEFLPPVWVGTRIDQGKIYLNWDSVPNAVAYNIYRSTTAGTGYEVVGNTQATSHADKQNIESGQTYYYVLTAMNTEFEETAHSEEKAVKFGMSKEERDKLAAEQSAIKLEAVSLSHLHDLVEGEEGQPMNQPADVYSNSKGSVYVSDALNARVHCFDANGKNTLTFGTSVEAGGSDFENGAFKIPFTIYIDNKDQIYVADIGRNDIQVFAADGSFVKRIAVKLEDGMKPLRANGVCALDGGRLAISDTGNHRFLIVDTDGNILSSKGKQGNNPGEFAFPGEIERSAGGELFLLDVINSRVQVLDLDGNFLRQFGGVGEGAGVFGRPAGLAVDPSGRVWVTDNMSSMVQSFTPEGEVKSIVGSANDEWHFVAPRGIHFVGDRVYIVDRLANKVIVFGLG
jgi:sugar lactone lactonase YvrE